MDQTPWHYFFPKAYLISLGFLILNTLWLSVLPLMNISYGTITGIFYFALIEGIIFIICIGLWLVFRYLWDTPNHILPLSLLILLNTMLVGIGVYGFVVEPFRLTISHVEMEAPGLSRPIRIIHLSDIHVERTTRREREIPPLVESLNPDLIVMTGDYPNESYTGDDQTGIDLRELVSQLQAPLGIYAVNGNVEEPWMMPLLLEKMDIRILDNEIVRVPQLGEHFALIGLSYVSTDPDGAILKDLVTQLQPDDFTILLYHKPDLAYIARDLPIDLYLAGHTHGGQVRLPFYGALITNSKLGKTFEMGLYHLEDMTLYVSRGLGMSGGMAPRIRLLAPPEVVVFDLAPN